MASNNATVVVERKLLVVSASTTKSVPGWNVGSVVSTGAGDTTLIEAEPTAAEREAIDAVVGT